MKLLRSVIIFFLATVTLWKLPLLCMVEHAVEPIHSVEGPEGKPEPGREGEELPGAATEEEEGRPAEEGREGGTAGPAGEVSGRGTGAADVGVPTVPPIEEGKQAGWDTTVPQIVSAGPTQIAEPVVVEVPSASPASDVGTLAATEATLEKNMLDHNWDPATGGLSKSSYRSERLQQFAQDVVTSASQNPTGAIDLILKARGLAQTASQASAYPGTSFVRLRSKKLLLDDDYKTAMSALNESLAKILDAIKGDKAVLNTVIDQVIKGTPEASRQEMIDALTTARPELTESLKARLVAAQQPAEAPAVVAPTPAEKPVTYKDVNAQLDLLRQAMPDKRVGLLKKTIDALALLPELAPADLAQQQGDYAKKIGLLKDIIKQVGQERDGTYDESVKTALDLMSSLIKKYSSNYFADPGQPMSLLGSANVEIKKALVGFDLPQIDTIRQAFVDSMLNIYNTFAETKFEAETHIVTDADGTKTNLAKFAYEPLEQLVSSFETGQGAPGTDKKGINDPDFNQFLTQALKRAQEQSIKFLEGSDNPERLVLGYAAMMVAVDHLEAFDSAKSAASAMKEALSQSFKRAITKVGGLDGVRAEVANYLKNAAFQQARDNKGMANLKEIVTVDPKTGEEDKKWITVSEPEKGLDVLTRDFKRFEELGIDGLLDDSVRTAFENRATALLSDMDSKYRVAKINELKEKLGDKDPSLKDYFDQQLKREKLDLEAWKQTMDASIAQFSGKSKADAGLVLDGIVRQINAFPAEAGLHSSGAQAGAGKMLGDLVQTLKANKALTKDINAAITAKLSEAADATIKDLTGTSTDQLTRVVDAYNIIEAKTPDGKKAIFDGFDLAEIKDRIVNNAKTNVIPGGDFGSAKEALATFKSFMDTWQSASQPRRNALAKAMSTKLVPALAREIAGAAAGPLKGNDLTNAITAKIAEYQQMKDDKGKSAYSFITWTNKNFLKALSAEVQKAQAAPKPAPAPTPVPEPVKPTAPVTIEEPEKPAEPPVVKSEEKPAEPVATILQAAVAPVVSEFEARTISSETLKKAADQLRAAFEDPSLTENQREVVEDQLDVIDTLDVKVILNEIVVDPLASRIVKLVLEPFKMAVIEDAPKAVAQVAREQLIVDAKATLTQIGNALTSPDIAKKGFWESFATVKAAKGGGFTGSVKSIWTYLTNKPAFEEIVNRVIGLTEVNPDKVWSQKLLSDDQTKLNNVQKILSDQQLANITLEEADLVAAERKQSDAVVSLDNARLALNRSIDPLSERKEPVDATTAAKIVVDPSKTGFITAVVNAQMDLIKANQEYYTLLVDKVLERAVALREEQAAGAEERGEAAPSGETAAAPVESEAGAAGEEPVSEQTIAAEVAEITSVADDFGRMLKDASQKPETFKDQIQTFIDTNVPKDPGERLVMLNELNAQLEGLGEDVRPVAQVLILIEEAKVLRDLPSDYMLSSDIYEMIEFDTWPEALKSFAGHKGAEAEKVAWEAYLRGKPEVVEVDPLQFARELAERAAAFERKEVQPKVLGTWQESGKKLFSAENLKQVSDLIAEIKDGKQIVEWPKEFDSIEGTTSQQLVFFQRLQADMRASKGIDPQFGKLLENKILELELKLSPAKAKPVELPKKVTPVIPTELRLEDMQKAISEATATIDQKMGEQRSSITILKDLIDLLTDEKFMTSLNKQSANDAQVIRQQLITNIKEAFEQVDARRRWIEATRAQAATIDDEQERNNWLAEQVKAQMVKNPEWAKEPKPLEEVRLQASLRKLKKALTQEGLKDLGGTELSADIDASMKAAKITMEQMQQLIVAGQPAAEPVAEPAPEGEAPEEGAEEGEATPEQPSRKTDEGQIFAEGMNTPPPVVVANEGA